MIYRFRSLLAVVILSGASAAVAQESPDPARLLPWGDAQALSDAEAAIASGEFYVHLVGGIACRPAVADEDVALARTLLQRSPFCGCIVEDWELYQAQIHYAEVFSRRIIEHVKSQPQRNAQLPGAGDRGR